MGAAHSLTSPASSEIASIREMIAQNTNEHGFHLSQERSRILCDRLGKINQLIATLERELAVYRISEESRAAAGILDDLVGDFLSEEASDIEELTGNLVFPEFGQKGGQ